jgi:ubiquitin-conjugating enzyme E2 G1
MPKAPESKLGAQLLMKQFRELSNNAPEGIFVGLEGDDIFKWTVLLQGPERTMYSGGYFNCTLTFPPNFPNSPPKMVFTTPNFWHPNVYNTTGREGEVCISILHEHKVDAFNPQELMSEKWRPIIGVEAVLISVLSMLDAPNLNSPANIDAATQLRNDPEGYRTRIRRLVRQTQDDL